MTAANPAPLLSICVPTYNRARPLTALIGGLLANVLAQHGARVEVVVSNNCSSDGTAEVLAGFTHPSLRVISPPKHLDSAEQNMFSALPHLRGAYIWFVGDDDVLNFSAFDRLLALLEEGASDCYIFNSPVLSPTGRTRSLAPIRANAPVLNLSMRETVVSVGLLLTLAGITNIVQRRSLISADRAHHWAAQSRIYSHVAWLAEANRDARVALVNMAVVYYRQNDYADGRWERAAERDGVPDLYYWTFGLGRLLQGLTDADVLRPIDIGAILELAEDGRRYKLVDDVAFKIFQQIEKAVETKAPRQWPAYEAVIELLSFLRTCDPLLYDVTAHIEDFYRAASAGLSNDALAAYREKFHVLIADKQHGGVFLGRFCGRMHGFDAYRTAIGYVGVCGLTQGEVDEALGILDPAPDNQHLIVAPSLDALAGIAGEIAGANTTYGRPSPPHPSPRSPEDDEPPPFEAASLAALTAEIAELRASTSWRVTAPLRWLATRLAGRREPGA